MSRESREWLSTMCLIGFTAQRGNAWHWRRGDGNHFPAEIPLEVVMNRLFDWTPLEGTIESTVIEQDGVLSVFDPDRKAIIRPESNLGPAKILGVFSNDYRVHSYSQWLIQNVSSILDSGLSIGGAGLLREGAQAYVQVEVPETVDTPEGVKFRPHLTAATSLDGSLATTYKRGNQIVVCDNTMHAALRDEDYRIKIRHTSKSLGKINSVREALGIVYQEAEDFAAEIKSLCSTRVTDVDFSRWLNAYAPLPDTEGKPLPGDKARKSQAFTLANNKREALLDLWETDPRVTPWAHTAFGVLQTANTYQTHIANVRGMDRAQRNQSNLLADKIDRDDKRALQTLNMALMA